MQQLILILFLLYQVTETATATNTLTYHYDYRGSTVALTDGNGNVTDRIEYSAYGLTTYRAGTSDTPFLFNGRYGVQTDANGLLYMQARYYNPYLCRFVSQDPSGFGGGLNFYAYANGNPVSLIDPFGLGAAEAAQSASWLRGLQDQFASYQEQSAPMTFEQTLSTLLNMVPVAGGLKMAGEAMYGQDFVSGDRIQNNWAHAGMGVLNVGLSFAGFVEAEPAGVSVPAPSGLGVNTTTIARSAAEGTQGLRSLMSADEAARYDAYWNSLTERAPVQSTPFNIVRRYDASGGLSGATTYDAFGNRAYQYEFGSGVRHGEGYHIYNNAVFGSFGDGPRSDHINY